jgi:hypothetical protein
VTSDLWTSLLRPSLLQKLRTTAHIHHRVGGGVGQDQQEQQRAALSLLLPLRVLAVQRLWQLFSPASHSSMGRSGVSAMDMDGGGAGGEEEGSAGEECAAAALSSFVLQALEEETGVSMAVPLYGSLSLCMCVRVCEFCACLRGG